jgi:hypothetical protein
MRHVSGQPAEAYERQRNFPIDPKFIDAMVLSHIDHSGKAAKSQFCQKLRRREQGG